MTHQPELTTSQAQEIAAIAKRILFMKTLETQNSDALDFSEVSVWGVKRALELAFQAGMEAANAKT